MDLDEIEEARSRIERFLGVRPGGLGSDANIAVPYGYKMSPQDTTGKVGQAYVAPGEREQVIYDIWQILRTASVLTR